MDLVCNHTSAKRITTSETDEKGAVSGRIRDMQYFQNIKRSSKLHGRLHRVAGSWQMAS